MILALPAVDAPVASGTKVLLAYEEEDQACSLARGQVAGASEEAVHVEVGPIDHAVATWALQTGTVRLAARDEALADCTGLPPVHELYAPPHGLALGLERPAASASADGTRGAASLGGPDTWIVYPDPACIRPCHGELVFTHADGPPTLFTVHNDAAVGPEPLEVHLPPGGAAVVKVRPGTAWHFPGEDVRVVDLGETLLLLTAERVTVDGFVRLPGEDPRPVRLSHGEGWGQPREVEVAVGLDKKRAFKLDRDAQRVWVADEAIATAEVRGRRLTIRALASGRTHVAVDDGTGEPRLVRLIIAE